MCCASLCSGAPLGEAGQHPRRNTAGKQLCELCRQRLDRVKHHRPHGVGRACAPRCKPTKHAITGDDASVPQTAERSHKRARSDPGESLPAVTEPLNLTRLRVRAPRVKAPPSPPPPPAKKAHIIPANVSLLLDQAHARRMAAAAAQAAAPASPLRALHNAMVNKEKAEMASRTPAQWARRDYLQNVAPRCERCNFPRTGRKGWNEKTGCHTDKDCNNNRWRTIDLFC